MIIFDLCGAGALGGVIAASSFPTDVADLLGVMIPLAVIPFILACFIQTAQGSRLVTAVITADIIAGTAIPHLIPASALFLMIAAGTMVISYASDPFFWLMKRTACQSVRRDSKDIHHPACCCRVCGVWGCCDADLMHKSETETPTNHHLWVSSLLQSDCRGG